MVGSITRNIGEKRMVRVSGSIEGFREIVVVDEGIDDLREIGKVK